MHIARCLRPRPCAITLMRPMIVIEYVCSVSIVNFQWRPVQQDAVCPAMLTVEPLRLDPLPSHRKSLPHASWTCTCGIGCEGGAHWSLFMPLRLRGVAGVRVAALMYLCHHDALVSETTRLVRWP